MDTGQGPSGGPTKDRDLKGHGCESISISGYISYTDVIGL